MRVGVVGPVGPERFAENIGDALRRMGHAVVQLGPARTRSGSRVMRRVTTLTREALPGLDERVQRRIVRTALAQDCDVIINVDLRLMPDAVSKLKRGGSRVVFWFPDHVANLGRQLMLLGPYDALFFKDPHIVECMRATLDVPVYYLPEGCNPKWHRPLVPAGTEPYLVMLGNMYPYRVRLLERLIAKGIPLKLYGDGFPYWIGESSARAVHTGRCIFRDEKATVFRSAAGVLSTMHPAEIAGSNGRLFQAAGSGGAVLTEFRPAIPELFSVGQEVLAYHDFDDLLAQATRLLNEDGLTVRLGNAATWRAHREHTHDLRIARIFEKIA